MSDTIYKKISNTQINILNTEGEYSQKMNVTYMYICIYIIYVLNNQYTQLKD